MLALDILAREGNHEEAAARLGDIVQLLDRLEPKNHALYHDVSLSFARLVSGCVKGRWRGSSNSYTWLV